jgi:hypothetical protein
MSIEIINERETINFLGDVPRIAIHVTRAAIEDIGDILEDQAKIEAPQGETGALRAHPVDRTDVTIGEITESPSMRIGSVSVRGPGGRFMGAAEPGEGRLIARSTMTVAKEPKHAIWVHNGTGVYGRFHHPIVARRPNGFMVFDAYGRHFRRKTVKGQQANPFLEKAYVIINKDYVPLRVERLRLEIRALT